MANYLCIYPAKDSHIRFMEKYPGSTYAYCEGQLPTFADLFIDAPSFLEKLLGRGPLLSESTMLRDLPEDWPREEQEYQIGPEVNHRNVDLYHRILNNTADPVVGPGSLFQTWFHKTHSAIRLDPKYGESFAFTSESPPKLRDLCRRVTVETVRAQFTAWLEAKDDMYTPDDDACQETVKEFLAFAESLDEVIARGDGIIWVNG